MCAEAVPWRCHRSLIADALLARGIEVREITSATRAQPHTLTPWGKVTGRQVTYPAESFLAGRPSTQALNADMKVLTDVRRSPSRRT